MYSSLDRWGWWGHWRAWGCCGPFFQSGSPGHEDFTESLDLFADKVLPSLRSLP
jgi:hypothetical protein